MKPPRKVFIDASHMRSPHFCIFVRYADRKKYTRHSPAQFDSRDISVNDVKKWVTENPELELVEKERAK